MIWAIAIVFLILSITLISGKGAFLIAGYNTASKSEKLKYDEKKLCRVMGSGMGIITAFLIVLAFFGDNSPSWMFVALAVVIITVVIVMIILCNTICKVKNYDITKEIADKDKKNTRIVALVLIFMVITFVVIGSMLYTGQIKIAVDQNNIKIDGSYWTDYNVQIDSIKSISYVQNLKLGSRTNGLGSFKLLEGHFRNDEFGNYILYAYLKSDSYVVLDTSSGIVVINAENQQKTESLYKLLKSSVDLR